MSLTREQFVKKYSPFVSKVVKGTGILVGTVLAQAIIESQGKTADGSYKVGASKLAREANNYFGIKCSNWKGKVYNIDTGEYTSSGQYYVEKASCFRAYPSVEDSIVDYVKFLKENPRYEKAGVFKANSVKEQAEALKRAGYATAPNYASTIESVYNGIKSNIKEVAKVQINFVKNYWWVILLGTAGVVGIVYAAVKMKK